MFKTERKLNDIFYVKANSVIFIEKIKMKKPNNAKVKFLIGGIHEWQTKQKTVNDQEEESI